MSETDAPLKNVKHERFAQLVAQGASYSQAYIALGNKPSDPHASRLAGKVRARIQQLKSRAVISHDVTMDELISNYREDRRDAREAKQYGAAVSATNNLAKLTGHMVDRHEVRGQIDIRALVLSVAAD